MTKPLTQTYRDAHVSCSGSGKTWIGLMPGEIVACPRCGRPTKTKRVKMTGTGEVTIDRVIVAAHKTLRGNGSGRGE